MAESREIWTNTVVQNLKIMRIEELEKLRLLEGCNGTFKSGTEL